MLIKLFTAALMCSILISRIIDWVDETISQWKNASSPGFEPISFFLTPTTTSVHWDSRARQTGLALGPDLRVLKIGFLFKQEEPLAKDYFRKFNNSNASSIKPMRLGWVAYRFCRTHIFWITFQALLTKFGLVLLFLFQHVLWNLKASIERTCDHFG